MRNYLNHKAYKQIAVPVQYLLTAFQSNQFN